MPDFTQGAVTVRTPATSANLGPGFDSLGLALELSDVITAEVWDRGTTVVLTGEGAAELPRDDTHLVVSTLRTMFERWGLPQPGLRLTCRNAIPQGRGLGSSAAAISAGLLLAEALVPERSLTERQALRLATAFEGHPDNVAACLLGGVTVSWTDDGVPSAVSLEVAGSVVPVLVVAPTAMATGLARELLPPTVTHRDAGENAARAALLVAALTSSPGLLLPATVDLLHQEARRPAMPSSMELVDALRSSGVAAVLSGAGPSVLALCRPHEVESVLIQVPTGWRGLQVAVDRFGVRIEQT